MLLEHLTSLDVREAPKKGLIAVLPVGSVEVHGPHMLIRTDSMTVYNIAKLAAEKEEAVVLPPLYYAYVPQNRHFLGTMGHACELETGVGLYLFGNLVKMGSIKREARIGRTGLPKEVETSVDWQAYATDLYLGDPRLATEEKGRIFVENLVDFLAQAVRMIKQDTNVQNILDNFYRSAYEKQ